MEMIDKFEKEFIADYGTVKYNKVKSRIDNSTKILTLFEQSRGHGHLPPANTWLNYVYTVGYFLTSNVSTKALAGVLALKRWNSEVNIEERIASSEDVNMLARDIIYSAGIPNRQ